MRKAADKTYFSKNKFEKYQREKNRISAENQIAPSQSPIMLAPIQELKEENMQSMVEENFREHYPRNELFDSSSSGEEVDDDDLGDMIDLNNDNFDNGKQNAHQFPSFGGFQPQIGQPPDFQHQNPSMVGMFGAPRNLNDISFSSVSSMSDYPFPSNNNSFMQSNNTYNHSSQAQPQHFGGAMELSPLSGQSQQKPSFQIPGTQPQSIFGSGPRSRESGQMDSVNQIGSVGNKQFGGTTFGYQQQMPSWLPASQQQPQQQQPQQVQLSPIKKSEMGQQPLSQQEAENFFTQLSSQSQPQTNTSSRFQPNPFINQPDNNQILAPPGIGAPPSSSLFGAPSSNKNSLFSPPAPMAPPPPPSFWPPQQPMGGLPPPPGMRPPPQPNFQHQQQPPSLFSHNPAYNPYPNASAFNPPQFNPSPFYNPLQMNTQSQRAAPKQKYKRGIDTNIFSIPLSVLKDEVELATGDPVYCGSCTGIFNCHSKIEESKEEQSWKCEFCNHLNGVDLEPEEIPKTEVVNYMLEAVAQMQNKNQNKKDISIVFCIDTSGSMCVSQPIQGHHILKGDKLGAIKDELAKFGDGSDQRLQGDYGVTYVSRMQCVQSAIAAMLDDMAKTAPDRKVGLVSFSREVTVLGDGTAAPETIAGDKLYDYNFLLSNGEQLGKVGNKTIKDTKASLLDKLMSLYESGSTALGPALLTSVAMAAQGSPGSTVILCTDGLSNVGIGNFDDVFTDEESKLVDDFYQQVGAYAKEKGVQVNIVSIKGEECNIDTLCKVSELTGGDVQRVDPKDLVANFSNILQQQIIATNVHLKVKLHKGLEFRNEESGLSQDNTVLQKDLGSVTLEKEVTFEYKLKKVKELVKMPDVDLESMQSFPFQAQIVFTTLEGVKCARVITHSQNISKDKEEVQRNADFEVLGMNAIQQTAKIAKQGDYKMAQVNARAWDQILQKGLNNEQQFNDFQNYRGNMGGMYSMLNQQRTASNVNSLFGPMGSRAGDEISNELFQGQNINAKTYKRSNQNLEKK